MCRRFATLHAPAYRCEAREPRSKRESQTTKSPLRCPAAGVDDASRRCATRRHDAWLSGSGDLLRLFSLIGEGVAALRDILAVPAIVLQPASAAVPAIRSKAISRFMEVLLVEKVSV
ncbi:MAG: hypothetical protein CPSOU_0753 [uncultured Paraburkholderia sp.]|nr:MAG: hypothetical protein CPSOU_0753 [uncultured Paraburkholderia sp.]